MKNKYTGVTRIDINGSIHYRAAIGANGRSRHLGTYKTEEEAAIVVENAMLYLQDFRPRAGNRPREYFFPILGSALPEVLRLRGVLETEAADKAMNTPVHSFEQVLPGGRVEVKVFGAVEEHNIFALRATLRSLYSAA